MRQQNAFQAVRGEGPFQTKQVEEGCQPALPTVDAQNTEHRHQHGQDQRHRAQPQQGKPAGETSAIEGACRKMAGIVDSSAERNACQKEKRMTCQR